MDDMLICRSSITVTVNQGTSVARKTVSDCGNVTLSKWHPHSVFLFWVWPLSPEPFPQVPALIMMVTPEQHVTRLDFPALCIHSLVKCLQIMELVIIMLKWQGWWEPGVSWGACNEKSQGGDCKRQRWVNVQAWDVCVDMRNECNIPGGSAKGKQLLTSAATCHISLPCFPASLVFSPFCWPHYFLALIFLQKEKGITVVLLASGKSFLKYTATKHYAFNAV